MSEDFITTSIAKLDAVKESQDTVRSTHLVAGDTQAVAGDIHKMSRVTRRVVIATLTMAAGLMFAAAYTLAQIEQSESLIVAAINELDPSALGKPQVLIEVQQWTSGAFASGSVECGVTEQQKTDPCLWWYSRSPTGAPQPTDLRAIVDANRDTVLIFASGGHDRVRLNIASRETLLSNDNIALKRAEVVAAKFKEFLAEVRKDEPARALPDTFTWTRGVWDTERSTPSDRTVTVTLVRSEGAL